MAFEIIEARGRVRAAWVEARVTGRVARTTTAWGGATVGIGVVVVAVGVRGRGGGAVRGVRAAGVA